MSDKNPFTPPNAPVADQPRGPGSPIKGVTLGLVIDIGGTVVAGIVMSIIYSVIRASEGVGAEAVMQELKHIDPTSLFGLVSSLVGLGFSYLGGFVCARIVKRSEMRPGSVLAALAVLTGWLLGNHEDHLAWMLGMSIINVAVVLAGTMHGQRRNRAAEARAA